MSPLPDFTSFFHALWGFSPFPWQVMLAERVANGSWPKALDLPTAAGKTACIEIALYALAVQAERPTEERTAPRRIWFVVDRRIVVDEAYDRAEEIAKKLDKASDGPLWEVAERLRQVAGTERPFALARLRGGILLDDGWARLPSQPAVITSTVDQLGSRLLFRGYGHSQLAAPIFAGIAANDSLVILDEAHCSVAFLQTLSAIEIYRGPEWAEEPLRTPFAFVMLSATPPSDIPVDGLFPGPRRDAALDHPELQKRLRASKQAELIEVKGKLSEGDDPLVERAVRRSLEFLRLGKRRVGVMVNRVRTAERIATALRDGVGEQVEVVLLTGRIRPFERDRLVGRWSRYLRAFSPADPPKPLVMISTQCLEVGADFSFDALTSESASLDALRQRFGRLDRMGDAGTSPAAILVRSADADPNEAEADPIYGSSIAATWQLLKEHATADVIDFGFETLRDVLRDVEDPSPYLTPVAEAPVLLPAHLDLLCQTSPTPHPEPEPQLFLHGNRRGAPEVHVLWRSDLVLDDSDTSVETVAMCPPVSGEMLSTPLYRLLAFLSDSLTPSVDGDVEGVPAPDQEDGPDGIRPCVVWRGRESERSKVAWKRSDLAPGDVIVLPASYGISGLGQAEREQALGEGMLDVWEAAFENAGRPLAVRLNRAVLAPWLECPPLHALLAIAQEEEPERERLYEAIEDVLAYSPANEDAPPPPPAWWLDTLRELRTFRMEKHPAGGLVLFGPQKLVSTAEPDLFADDDDLTSLSGREATLDEHSELVRRTAEKLAERCLPEQYRDTLTLAAYWHDVGKLDERFQILLHHGDVLAALDASAPLAKSSRVPTSLARRRAIRVSCGLPRNFRHEMLSAQLADRHAPKSDKRESVDLFLHLIASHHGHARPFALPSEDPRPGAVSGRLAGRLLTLTADERITLPPLHRVDSGVADRFWRLVRRHGWWGLAYFEALLRLGDWYASGLGSKER